MCAFCQRTKTAPLNLNYYIIARSRLFKKFGRINRLLFLHLHLLTLMDICGRAAVLITNTGFVPLIWELTALNLQHCLPQRCHGESVNIYLHIYKMSLFFVLSSLLEVVKLILTPHIMKFALVLTLCDL